MTTRSRIAALTLTVATLTTLGVTQAHAAIIATPAQTVHTCKPRAIVYDGPMRADNDLFAGSPGTSCITVRNSSLTMTRCITGNGPGGRPGTVVAYPNLYEGINGTSGDKQSVFPVRVTKAQGLAFRLTATGKPTCPVNNFIQDVDIRLSDTAKSAGKPMTGEIVIALRFDHGFTGPFRRVSIDNHWYLVSPRTTGPAGHTWPLLLVVSQKQTTSRTIKPAKFLYHLRKLGWLAPGTWFDSIHFGAEAWIGDNRLCMSMKPVTK